MTQPWKKELVLEALANGELALQGSEFVMGMIDAVELGIPFSVIVSGLEDNYRTYENSKELFIVLDRASSWIRENQKELELNFEASA